MQSRSSWTGARALVLFGFTATSVALAAEPPPAAGPVSGLVEIEVTARRVSESVQSVPIAVTAIDSAVMERQQITSIRSLDTAIPNIVFVPNTGQASAATIFLRGVGEDESFFTADPPVGIYIDDVYIPRQTGALFDLYDVERIEVLRGPQGTLYGRNTSAGAVKLESRKPGFDPRFSIDARIGSFGRQDVRAAVSGPLVADKVAGQVALMSRQFDGYTKNLTTGKRVNDQDLVGGRASLTWKASDSFDVLLVADAIRERSGPGYGVAIQNNVNPGKLAVVSDWNETTSDLVNPQQDVDQNGISLISTYSEGDTTFKSITAWRSLSQDIYLDADGRAGNPGGFGTPAGSAVAFHLAQQQDQSQISQEFQLAGSLLGGRANYVAGLYYFHENNKQRTHNIALVPATTAPFRGNHTYVTLGTDSIAAFANGTYNFTDALSISGGLRWTQDDKDFHIEARDANSAIRATTTGAPAQRDISKRWSSVTPRLSLDYQMEGDGWRALAYFSGANGFKSGSFDGRESVPNFIVSGLSAIEPESVWSYELGLKADWLDRTLRTNVALFLNDYTDIQFGITKADGSGFTRLNAGDARIKGAELELTWVPREGLELFANLGLLDGEYTKFRDPGACFFSSEAAAKSALVMKKAPKNSWRVGGSYEWAIGDTGAVTVGGDYSRKSRYYNNLCNSPWIATDGYENLNAQVAYETPDRRWRFTLAGSNLTDKVFFQGGFDLSAALGDAVYVVPPRMWSLSARYSFE